MKEAERCEKKASYIPCIRCFGPRGVHWRPLPSSHTLKLVKLVRAAMEADASNHAAMRAAWLDHPDDAAGIHPAVGALLGLAV